MKSALARQGSLSRVPGPRSLTAADEDGSPRKRAAKSVKFDQMDEIIRYVAPTPEITEDNWDAMSLESCESDNDGRPLPTLPDFIGSPNFETGPSAAENANLVPTSYMISSSPRSRLTTPPFTSYQSREERLLSTPRYQSKLNAPLGTSDDDFDFDEQIMELSKGSTPPSLDTAGEHPNGHPTESTDEASKSESATSNVTDKGASILPSPLHEAVSPVIEQPPMSLRMDVIMDGSSGMSPSLGPKKSWRRAGHQRFSSITSDSSDGGEESYFPVRKIDLPEPDDPEEAARWRSQKDSALARQDSLQDDQRHPQTESLSKSLPAPPAELGRTYSKRRKDILQLLDPHGAGVQQKVGFGSIPEEEEEEDANTSLAKYDAHSYTESHKYDEHRYETHRMVPPILGEKAPAESPSDPAVDQFAITAKGGAEYDDDHHQETYGNSYDPRNVEMDSSLSEVSEIDQSIGISSMTAAQFANRSLPNMDSTMNNSSQPLNTSQSMNLSYLLPMLQHNDSFEFGIFPSASAPALDSMLNSNASLTTNSAPSSERTTPESNTLPPATQRSSANPGELASSNSFDVSRITYYDSADLDKLESPKSVSSIESVLLPVRSNSSPRKSSSPSNKAAFEPDELDAPPVLPEATDIAQPVYPVEFSSPQKALSPEQTSSPKETLSRDYSLQASSNESTPIKEASRVAEAPDRTQSIETPKHTIPTQTIDLPRETVVRRAFPGALPWDPSMESLSVQTSSQLGESTQGSNKDASLPQEEHIPPNVERLATVTEDEPKASDQPSTGNTPEIPVAPVSQPDSATAPVSSTTVSAPVPGLPPVSESVGQYKSPSKSMTSSNRMEPSFMDTSLDTYVEIPKTPEIPARSPERIRKLREIMEGRKSKSANTEDRVNNAESGASDAQNLEMQSQSAAVGLDKLQSTTADTWLTSGWEPELSDSSAEEGTMGDHSSSPQSAAEVYSANDLDDSDSMDEEHGEEAKFTVKPLNNATEHGKNEVNKFEDSKPKENKLGHSKPENNKLENNKFEHSHLKDSNPDDNKLQNLVEHVEDHAVDENTQDRKDLLHDMYTIATNTKEDSLDYQREKASAGDQLTNKSSESNATHDKSMEAEKSTQDITSLSEELDPATLRYLRNADGSNDENYDLKTKQRQVSNASLRGRPHFVPSSVPSLSPIDFSNTPFMSSRLDDEISTNLSSVIESDVGAQQLRTASLNRPLPEFQASRSYSLSGTEKERSSADSTKSPIQDSANLSTTTTTTNDKLSDSSRAYGHEKSASLQETSILRDMSLNNAQLAQFRNDPASLDNDLSDIDESIDNLVDEDREHGPRVAVKQEEAGPAPVSENTNVLVIPSPRPLPQMEISIREPSFGESISSTMRSMVSERFGSDHQVELQPRSSRGQYTVRESGSYVIATSPERRPRNRHSLAYDIVEEENDRTTRAFYEQAPIPRNRSTFDSLASSLPNAPSAISQSGSNYSSQLGSSHYGSSQYGSSQFGSSQYPSSQFGSQSKQLTISNPDHSATVRSHSAQRPPIQERVPSTLEPVWEPASPVKEELKTHSQPVETGVEKPAEEKPIHVPRIRPSRENVREALIQEKKVDKPVASQENTSFVKQVKPIEEETSVISAVEESHPPSHVTPKQSSDDSKGRPRALSTIAPSLALNPPQQKTVTPISVNSYPQRFADDEQLPQGVAYLHIKGMALNNANDMPSNTLVTMTIDNGVHCVSSRALKLTDLAEYNEGYRIGIMNGTSATIVLKLQQPKHSENSTGPMNDYFDMGSDGSYAQFELMPFQKTAFGKCREMDIYGRNHWSVRRSVVATMSVEALYVPCVSRKEVVPHSIGQALTKIEAARKSVANRPPRAAGLLRQFGGGITRAKGKQRHCVLDPVSPLLVIHSARNRRPRALINLAKATRVQPLGDNSFELQFKNKDSLAFQAPRGEDLQMWESELKKAIGTEGARPKWIDAILYE